MKVKRQLLGSYSTVIHSLFTTEGAVYGASIIPGREALEQIERTRTILVEAAGTPCSSSPHSFLLG